MSSNPFLVQTMTFAAGRPSGNTSNQSVSLDQVPSFPQPVRHDRHPFSVHDLAARRCSIARNGASNLIIGAGTDKRQYVIRRRGRARARARCQKQR